MMSELNDPHLHFFQVLAEARRHRHHRESARDHHSSSSSGRFKLHKKPIGKDQDKKNKSSSSSSGSRKPRWPWSSWRSALDLFFVFKAKCPVHIDEEGPQGQPDYPERSTARAMAKQSGHSVSGPLYLADSRSMPRLRHLGYSWSGPLAARVPYVCLSPDFKTTPAPPPPPPFYLVT